MPKKIRALQDFTYAGIERHPGDEFEVEHDNHAWLLCAAMRAEEVKVAEASKRGRYRRNDMRADE